MKKIMRLLSVVCVFVLVLSCAITANAARPTTLTITEVKKAPVIDGVIDDSNGPKQWDQTASEIPVGEYDLYPRTPEECAPFSELYKFMNMKGYLTYDKDGIYIAVQATDYLPKAAPNSNEPWKSTNIQIVLYTNSSRNFFTVAYAGQNKANIFNDETRSELEIDKVKDYCVKETISGNKATLVWELKVPYEALWEVKSMDDIKDMRLGIVQSSMSTNTEKPYACQAFGKAYSLVYEDLLPVTIKSLSGKPAATSSKEDTATESGSGNGIVSATGSGVDFGAADTGASENTDANSSTPNSDDTATTGAEEGGNNTTLIIIIAAVAAVIVIGGVVAIILINKK